MRHLLTSQDSNTVSSSTTSGGPSWNGMEINTYNWELMHQRLDHNEDSQLSMKGIRTRCYSMYSRPATSSSIGAKKPRPEWDGDLPSLSQRGMTSSTPRWHQEPTAPAGKELKRKDFLMRPQLDTVSSNKNKKMHPTIDPVLRTQGSNCRDQRPALRVILAV